MEFRQVLAPDGSAVGPLPDLDDKDLLELYRSMVWSRIADRRALAAQRLGRLGTYPMLEGHEAAQVGSAAAFAPHDFIYPAYREMGVQITRGMPLEVILAYWRGMPNEAWNPYEYHMMSIAVPIASQLPHAVGHAYQTRREGRDVVTGTYIGDGGTSEGDFHAALNFAGVWRTPTVFICQNNFYAISVPYEKQTAAESIAAKAGAYGMPGVRVDGMDVLAVYAATREAVERARRGGGPTLIEAVCYRYGAHATADDARRYRSEEEETAWRQKDPVERMRRFLTDRGILTTDLNEEMEREAAAAFDRALTALEAVPPPPTAEIIRHAYARVPDQLVDQLHAIERARDEQPTPIDASERWERRPDPEPSGPTESMTMADAINRALHAEMARDEAVVVLGEDVGQAGGVFRITEGLQEAFGEERVIDTPLNESGIVGTAVGMAIAGGRPVAEIQFDGFVYPAFDQIVSHLGRIRFRTRGRVELPMVVRFPSGAGIGAHEHHCDSPEAYFMHAPGLVVVAPSNPYDAKGLLTAAIRCNDPVIFLEPKVLYRQGRQEVPVEAYEVPLGTARIARPGRDATVVTYGAMVPVSLRAAEALAADGAEVEVIDLRTIYPWDVATVTNSVRRTGRLLVVQEPQRTAGVAAEIAAEIGERCGWELDAPIRRMGGTDAPWPQFGIESYALITSDMVERSLRGLLAD